MKKVLVISYYWPPSGGIGVLRNLKFVKYLREYDWEPILFIPEKPSYPYLDNSNDKDIPDNLEIIKGKIFEPHRFFKSFTGQDKNAPLNNPVAIGQKKQGWREKIGIWIRGNFFIPDARMLWIRPSVKKILTYLENNSVDAIYSDGPPHTNTRIAALISEKTGIPWLADFQDPWTQVDYLQRFKLTPLAWFLHRKMEQHAFRNADKLTSASPRSAKSLEEIGATNVECLYYGYDESDFAEIKVQKEDTFCITHAGLLGNDRNPEMLFVGLSELLNELEDFKNQLKIKLVGDVDVEVLNEIKRLQLEPYVTIKGILPRSEALRIISNSHLLLLCINKASNASGRIPAKIFEYIRTGNDILALGPTESDISDILRSIEQTPAIEYHEKEEIKKRVQQSYTRFKQGIVREEHKNARLYDVKEITGQLASYFNQIIENRDAK